MKHKIIISVIIAAIALMSLVSATASENMTYSLIDPATDISYVVSINEDLVTVNKDNTEISHAKIRDVHGLSVCNGILNLFTVDRKNDILGVIHFDFYQNTTDSYSFYADVFDSPYCITSDYMGRVYYVSGKDTMNVCVYENGTTYEINLLSKVNQLLCADNNTILAFTNDNVYSISGNEYTKISDITLAVPATYKGRNVIADSNNTEYIHKKDSLSEAASATEAFATEAFTTEPATAEPTNATCKEIPDFYFADAGITVSKIKKAFAGFEISKITKANNTETKSGKLGTGAKIYFADNKITTVIIKGDLTGEGNINSRDIRAILDHLSTKELLKESYLIAADINSDGKITTKDALFTAKMYQTPSH